MNVIQRPTTVPYNPVTEAGQAASKQWLVKTLSSRRISSAMRMLICEGLQISMIHAFGQGGIQGATWHRIIELVRRVLAWNDSSQAELPGAALCESVRHALRTAGIESRRVDELLIALERPGAAMKAESHDLVVAQLAS